MTKQIDLTVRASKKKRRKPKEPNRGTFQKSEGVKLKKGRKKKNEVGLSLVLCSGEIGKVVVVSRACNGRGAKKKTRSRAQKKLIEKKDTSNGNHAGSKETYLRDFWARKRQTKSWDGYGSGRRIRGREKVSLKITTLTTEVNARKDL